MKKKFSETIDYFSVSMEEKGGKFSDAADGTEGPGRRKYFSILRLIGHIVESCLVVKRPL